MNRYKKNIIYFNILLTLMFLNTEFALGKGRRLIVDAEIESYIKSLIKPLTTVAKLDNNSLTIHLVEDEALNAFVTRGQKLFLHTGLLINTKNPAQLRGVLAHEIGHIAEGHLARTSKVLRASSNVTLLGIILGTATAAVTGQSEAAAAIFHGTTNMANKAVLKHSRTQESAADHAALRYLKKNQQTAQGLLEFLMTLKKKELLSTTNRSSYLDTHPLTNDRIESVQEHIKRSIDISQKESTINIAKHDRMVAKLIGFLHHPSKTFAHYPNPAMNIAAKYAWVIGLHRNAETKKALILLNELIKHSPEDPYFWELKGQLLFETAQPTKARDAYQKALFIEKHSPLIRQQLAKVELAIGTTEANISALKHLKKTVRLLPNSRFSWHNLAIAQGRTGNRAMANLSLAEAALLRHTPKIAITHAVRAKIKLKQGSPSYQRAIDIIELSDRLYKIQSK